MNKINCSFKDCWSGHQICTIPLKVSIRCPETSAYAVVGKVPTLAPIKELGGDNEKSVVVSLVDRTNALIRGLQIILTHHRVNSAVGVALEDQVHGYLDSANSESVWLKRGKFLLSYPFSKYLRNELPELPDCGPFIPKGHLRSFFKSRLISYSRKNTHLWFSWLQAKRSCLPASQDMINVTYDKHFQTLTKVDDADDKTINAIMHNEDFIDHLDVIRGNMKSFLLKETETYTDKTPSLSASFESSRSAGGSYNELNKIVNNCYGSHPTWTYWEGNPQFCDNYIEQDGIPVNPSFWLGQNSDLVKMEYRNITVRKTSTIRHSVVEIRSRGSLESQVDWNEELRKKRYASKRNFLCQLPKLDAKIQGIVEPMKVRVISKGPAAEYYAMKQIQQALHTSLRGMKCYRLIGRPLSPTDIMDLDDAPIRYGLTGTEEWISVDYSAATDNLSWKYSGKILDYLIQDLPLMWQNEARLVLGPHTLTYPKENGKGYEVNPRGVMERGQLMGSILSFPILCIANLGLYLHVTEAYQKDWKQYERYNSVLVNGDDMLYLAPRELFSMHIDAGKKVGLEMTVGKAYHHKSYTNVNSTCVICPIGGLPYQIDFLNTGLFQGTNKVMERVSGEKEKVEKERSGVVTVLNDCLSGSLPGRQNKLLRHWFNTIGKERIEQDTYVTLPTGRFFRNIFLPIEHGGMGVIPPIGWKFVVLQKDRKFAQLLIGDLCKNLQRVGVQQFPELSRASSDVIIPAVTFSAETDTCLRVRMRSNVKFTIPRYFSTKNLRLPHAFVTNIPYPKGYVA